jgi:hypothetical protein
VLLLLHLWRRVGGSVGILFSLLRMVPVVDHILETFVERVEESKYDGSHDQDRANDDANDSAGRYRASA